VGQKLFEPFPIIAFALAALVENLPQIAGDPMVKQGQVGEVAVNAEVVVIPLPFGIQQGEQLRQATMTVFLAPHCTAFVAVQV